MVLPPILCIVCSNACIVLHKHMYMYMSNRMYIYAKIWYRLLWSALLLGSTGSTNTYYYSQTRMHVHAQTPHVHVWYMYMYGTCTILYMCIKLSTSLPYLLLLGDFDSTGTTNTMLKHLLEQRTIGNREFLPLSGQALLGFRLLPGAVRIFFFFFNCKATFFMCEIYLCKLCESSTSHMTRGLFVKFT